MFWNLQKNGKNLYIKYANDILEIAKYIVISKSEYVDYDDITNMKYKLIKNGYYQIENGRTYECDMFLWKLNL